MTTNESLYNALRKAIQYIPMSPVECRWSGCREPWCISCCGEEAAQEAIEQAMIDLREMRLALDQYKV